MATVKRVDQRQGRLEFVTPEATFVLTTTPTALHGLRAGDPLLLCFKGDTLDGEERVAQDDPAETSRTRDALPLLP